MKDTHSPKFIVHTKEDNSMNERLEKILKLILIEFNETGELNKAVMYKLVRFITLFYPSEQSPEQKKEREDQLILEELKKIYKRSQARKD